MAMDAMAHRGSSVGGVLIMFQEGYGVRDAGMDGPTAFVRMDVGKVDGRNIA